MVIILTVYSYPQSLQKREEMGAEYFFDKSTEFHRVQEVLTELAASAQKNLPRKSHLEVDEKCR